MNFTQKSKTAGLLLLLAMMSAGCAGLSGKQDKIALPPAPADLKACLESGGVPPPPDRDMTRRELAALVGALKTSEIEKSQCGKRLIAWYAELAQGIK